MNAAGDAVARESAAATLAARSVTRQRLAHFEIDDPELWSPESPTLYRVVSTVRDGDRVLDRVDRPLGLRWFGVDAGTGFHLNGKPYRLFGTNRHQDYAGLGSALPDRLHRSDLRKIKGDGFNFLRLAHYPQDPAVLEAADELGLIVWEEIPVVNLIGMAPAFRENSTRMLREMIRQHRHHPSVAFWGYMNEVMLQKPDPVPENYYEEILALARHLDAVAREEDPSRLTVTAQSHDEVDNGVPIGEVPDVLALNLYFGWYYGEFGTLGDFLDRYHREHPDVPLMISEYGAGSDERVHALDPLRFDFSTEYQQRFHEQNFRQIRERSWLVGSAVWNQFDFGSNHRQDTKFAVNQKGLWTFDRSPKDIAWYYRAQLSEEPVLRIAARDWPRRAGSRRDDAVMPVRVYSNEPAVELLLNGRSLGSQAVRNAGAEWEIRFAPGDNVLTARSASLEDRMSVHYEDRSAMFGGDRTASGLIAVNAGAAEQIVIGNGRIREADRAYEAGSWGYIGGSGERSHHRIFGTDSDPLYQTQRRGEHRYRFDVADGGYLLTLQFAKFTENTDTTGDVQVRINGNAVNVPDLAPYTRHDAEALVAASNGGGIELYFSSESGAPFVNGIVLRRADQTGSNTSRE